MNEDPIESIEDRANPQAILIENLQYFNRAMRMDHRSQAAIELRSLYRQLREQRDAMPGFEDQWEAIIGSPGTTALYGTPPSAQVLESLHQIIVDLLNFHDMGWKKAAIDPVLRRERDLVALVRQWSRPAEIVNPVAVDDAGHTEDIDPEDIHASQ